MRFYPEGAGLREIIASKERDKGMLSWVVGGGGFGTPLDSETF